LLVEIAGTIKVPAILLVSVSVPKFIVE
jgi:hypothetical protein